MFLSQLVLIFDAKGKESGYAKQEDLFDSAVNSLVTDNTQDGFDLIDRYEPDLIIVQDNFKDDITDLCQKIRKKSSFYRPVLMAISGVKDVDKKIEILKSGADDHQHESIDKQELSLRIFAHLRRHVEELTDPTTKQPGSALSYRIIKRNFELKTDEQYALIYLDIDNFTSYKEVYGHIASEKLLQTFVAIIKTSLNDEDFLGRVGDDDFVIITTPDKAEKIAFFLSYSFDMVSRKFYTNEDVEKGYLMLQGDEKIGRRIPFVSVSMGIASNRFKTYESYEELVNSAMSMHRLAKSQAGSYWISDRPQIAGSDVEADFKKKILIVENDAALSYLLTTTLEMQGYNAEAINSSDQIEELIKSNMPDLIMLDTTDENADQELQTCRSIKERYPKIKVVVSTVDCNKEKVLDAGVDLYIPKPYELMVLFSWISRLLNYEALN